MRRVEAAAPPEVAGRLGGWDRLRLGLLAALVLVLVTTAAVGHRVTPLTSLVPVVGSLAMLILSGRTPGLPAPQATSRRLTGGWAFVLSAVVAGVLSGPGTTGGL